MHREHQILDFAFWYTHLSTNCGSDLNNYNMTLKFRNDLITIHVTSNFASTPAKGNLQFQINRIKKYDNFHLGCRLFILKVCKHVSHDQCIKIGKVNVGKNLINLACKIL